ncbi:hypothetical protein PAMP_000486 [Pampus punctatissimus]
MQVDPAYRMSANQLLENPWITGDTNMPAIPSNVLEMMRHHLEQEEITKTLEDLSLTSSEDTPDPSLLPKAAKSHAKINPKRDNSICTPSTSTKPSKESGGHLQQDKCKNVSETQGPPQPSTTQFCAGVKSSRQLSAKQRRPQDKRDVSTVQQPASDKADEHRPSTSIKNKTGFRKAPASSKATTHSERDKKQARSHKNYSKSTGDFTVSFHNTAVSNGDFLFSLLTSQFHNTVYAVTAPTQCQNRKTVTQAGYAPYECRGLGLRAATGLISFGGH